MPIEKEKLERVQAIASICASVAIPIVLVVIGYLIQREFSEAGLRKDYVSIAASVLKDDPTKQEPDLRAWAVKVLETNSPIPFTNKAKEGLLKGIPLVVPGPALVPPIEDCMQPPKDRAVDKAAKDLLKKIKATEDAHERLRHFTNFADAVLKAESEAGITAIRLKCMQAWAALIVEGDVEYRKRIGAEPSAAVYERLRAEAKARAAADPGKK